MAAGWFTAASLISLTKYSKGTRNEKDRAFFGDQHTGIVVAVSGSTITTIEGNTSGAGGVISNGGGVCRKTYTIGKTGMTFGRPKWELVGGGAAQEKPKPTVALTLPELSFGDTGGAVETVQRLLNSYGYNCGKCDGVWGTNTDAAILLYQRANGLVPDKICGKKTWDKLMNG